MAGTDTKDQIAIQTSSANPDSGPSSQTPPKKQDAPVVVTTETGETSEPREGDEEDGETPAAGDRVDEQKKGFLAYFKTKEFYITLVLGWVVRSISLLAG